MENYGNDMYLSQEGYPSIDFTLLDRPSSSIVPAREGVAQFPQGDSSFPSFDLFDGAGVESFNDQSFAGHGSYMLDAQNDAMRRHASGKLSVVSSHRDGVHDFFDQENQPQKSRSSTWPSVEQSPYFLPGPRGVEESLQRPTYVSNNYLPTPPNYNSQRSSSATGAIRPPAGFTRPIVGEAMDHIQLLNVSSAMQNAARNPLGSFGAQYQNQIDKYDVSNQAGVANNTSSHDFLGNQAPRRGPLQSSQAAAVQQFQGLARAAGISELQPQQQLQEMFIARQLKQLEDSRQQQMFQQAQNRFSKTSYSDLLHGPDTPPSQNQTTEEIAIEDYETQAPVLPLQIAQVSGWSAHDPPSYQGFVSDVDLGQNQSSTSQMSLFGETLDSNRHSGLQNGPALSSFSERQNAMPQYLGGGRISHSGQETGKSILQPGCAGSEHLGEIQTTNFGMGNDWNELRTNQKLSAIHNLQQRPADLLMGHKMKGNNLSQVGAFSQSQQHFQGLQLNEQRRCSFELKQSFPAQNSGILPQSNVNFPKSSSKIGMQQLPDSVNSTNNAARYSSYKLDSTPFDVDASCEQPRWTSALSSGVPSPCNNVNVGMGSQHQSNLWDPMLAVQPHQGANCNQQLISDAQYSSLSNSSSQQHLQQGSSMLVGVPRGSVEASTVRQQESYNPQNSLMNLRASSSNNAFNSSQTSLAEANSSDRLLQPFAEPSSHQGAWKKYAPPSHFPAGLATRGQPLDGRNPSYSFQGQGYVNSQASCHPMMTLKNKNNTSFQYDPHEHASKEHLSVKDDHRLERPNSQDLTGGLSTANFMKTLSRQAVKKIPDVVEEVQGFFGKSAEPQREVPEQQAESCTASISLAHLKGNQSSNSLSPQHVKLGLGPSNLSQDFQKVNEPNWRSFSQVPSLDREVPSLKSAHETFYTGSPCVNSVSEIKRKDGFGGITATIDGTILQSNTSHPLMSSHRSSPVSKEMDDSPPSSFASGHDTGPDAVFPASSTLHNPGRQPSQSKYGMGGDGSLGVSQAPLTTHNHMSSQDSFMNGYIGKSSCFSNNFKQPNYNAAAMLGQNQLINDNMRQSTCDDGGMNTVQNHQSGNMGLKQIGTNRAQAVNLLGSATTSKTSLLEQSTPMGSHGQEFSGVVESSRLWPNITQGLGGGMQIDPSRLVQKTQKMLNNPVKQGDKTHLFQTSNLVKQHTSDECKSQSDTSKARAFVIEGRCLMSNASSPNLQGDKIYQVSSLNCGLSSSLEVGGPSQKQNKYQPAKPLNAFTLESDAVEKSFSSPRLQAPSSFGQEHPVQHKSREEFQGIYNFEGPGSCVRARSLSESAVLSVPVRNKDPLNLGTDSADPGFVAEWAVSQPTVDPQLTTGEQMARFKAVQKDEGFVSKITAGKSADSVEVGYSQSPKHLGNSFVVSPSKDTANDGNMTMVSLEGMHQTVPYPSNLNQQSLFSVESKQDKLNMLALLPGNKEATFASKDQERKLPLGFQSSDFKDDGSRTPAQVPIPSQMFEHHLSSSKSITHGVETKKRKKQLPLLIPWHAAAAQSKIDLPTIGYAEELWANASNRLPQKDAMTTSNESTLSIYRAKRRLLLTTESMQRLLPPLPDGLMHENTPANKECAIYNLSKLALEDACRLVTQRHECANLAQISPASIDEFSPGQAYADNIALANRVESFMERVRQLGMELARLDCSTSVSELQGETHELEKLSIVNRLAKHHGIAFTMDSSDNLFIENIFGFGLSARKPPPQKYVTAAPMPRTLPEGVRCLSL